MTQARLHIMRFRGKYSNSTPPTFYNQWNGTSAQTTNRPSNVFHCKQTNSTHWLSHTIPYLINQGIPGVQAWGHQLNFTCLWCSLFFSEFLKHSLCIEYLIYSLKTKVRQFDNIIVIGGIVSCHKDNLRCHQWRHWWPLVFSVSESISTALTTSFCLIFHYYDNSSQYILYF